MSDRAIVITGFCLLLTVALAAAAVTRSRRDQVASLGETIVYLTSTRTTKITAVLVWAWLGWHFLAR
ncbi:hypothetical protein IU479_15045 [Nocardia abscessus]|uniref:DUF6186 family protein n=1 Tax=Nocardia TaxID=1817 RepID=UPI0018930D43|nr:MULTISPECIES: DUF6186 family protein [Nocardia]MBF6219426.1 hypothetical protein [Nocardia abscessus]MDE1673487.1 DUF6186 family protein [Nocardia gipuzkoensis]